MSGATAAARLGKTREEGEALLDNFFRGFPNVKVAIEESKKRLKKNGYVEDFYGRRRHLPEINLKSYEFKPAEEDLVYNPFLNCNKEKPKSYSIQFWELICDMFVNGSQEYQAKRNPNWKVNGEMANKTYELLAKIALHPYLWKKPCKTLEEIDSMKKHGTKDKTINKYLKSKESNIKYINGKLGTFGPTSKRPGEKFVSRSPELDADGNPIILTYEEFLRQSIAEFNNVIYPNAVLRFKNGDTEECVVDPISISPDIQLPTEPVLFLANTGRRAQAERQCFNARIQGGAATLTKLAMIDIANDQVMKDCQAKLIIPVHDELLVECPAYYADTVFKRLPDLMVGAAKKGGITDIPQKCDPYCVDRWYADEMAAILTDTFAKLESKGKTKQEALEILYKEHSEIPEKSILDVIEGRTPDEVIF